MNYKFHKTRTHEKVQLHFKCKHCNFDSTLITNMKNHLISNHGGSKTSATDFLSSRTLMCKSCLEVCNETPAEYEWPSWQGFEGPLNCSRCLKCNLDWWTQDEKQEHPQDIIHLESLRKVTFK